MFSPVQSVLLKAPHAHCEAQLSGVSRDFSGNLRQKGSGSSLGAEVQRGLLSRNQLNKFPLLDVGATPWTVIVSPSCGCRCTSCRDLSDVYKEITMK